LHQGGADRRFSNATLLTVFVATGKGAASLGSRANSLPGTPGGSSPIQPLAQEAAMKSALAGTALHQATASISAVVDGHDMKLGNGFTAKHFSEDKFDGLIDPVVMVDHFHMTAPTFEPHPHAGISAVTYVFEDTRGVHHNYDSLGNIGPIRPGDLHWFAAGRGAVHTEQPEGHDKPHVHALQIFVNLPASMKYDDPYAVHVNAEDMPELKTDGVRVRVVAGEAHGLRSPAVLPRPFTLLDAFLDDGRDFDHLLQAGWNAMVCVVAGKVAVSQGGTEMVVKAGQSLGIGAQQAAQLVFSAKGDVHFAILAGEALNEPLVKYGPFVMNTQEQMQDRVESYRRGDFGKLEMSGR
jgi:redox-sensitive bicupin YhaK (pirin superfamily)